MKLFKNDKTISKKIIKSLKKKIIKAIKHGRIIVIDKDKYCCIGITTILADIVREHSDYVLVVSSNMTKQYTIQNHNLNANQVITVGALANIKGVGLETKTLLLDNSIDYKIYRKYFSSYMGRNIISGIITEDLSTIEEFIF